MNNNTYVDKLIQKRDRYSNFKSNTGYKGISRRNNKYQACLSFTSGKNVKLYLGTYDTVEEAIAARNKFIDSLK